MSGEDAAGRGRRRPPVDFWTRRLRLVGAFTFAVCVALLLIQFLPLGLSDKKTFGNVAAAAAALVFALGALTYLQPDRTRTSLVEREAIVRMVAKHMADHPIRLGEPAITLTSDEREAAVKAIVSQFSADLVADEVRKLEASMRELPRQNSYLQPFDLARARLLRQSDALVRRGNLNLVIGMIMAGAGVFILGQSILAPIVFGSWDQLLSVYAPRLSLVLLIEIFAYFFLRLYKQSLEDGKYYQNELTNIELKLSAVNVSLDSDGEALRARVIDALIATERNFILEKGQSTVDLERARLQNDAMATNLRELGALLRSGAGARSSE